MGLIKKQKEVLDVIEKLTKGYTKKDFTLIESLYHSDAKIKLSADRHIVGRKDIRLIIKSRVADKRWPDKLAFSVKKIEIADDSAIVVGKQSLFFSQFNKQAEFPITFKLIKQDNQWLIIEQLVR